jgi:AAA+ superfamily predicted ATPase
VLLLAVSPELDVAYGRRLAELQADVTALRPSVGLVLRLLPGTAPGSSPRALFRTDGLLLRERLIRLVPDLRIPLPPPLTTEFVVVDEQIADVLLQQGGLDPRIARFATLGLPPQGGWSEVPIPARDRARLLKAARASLHRRPFRLNLFGSDGSGRRMTAGALAGELGMPLICVDLAQAIADQAQTVSDGLADLVWRVVREAELQGAVLHLRGVEEVLGIDGMKDRLLAGLGRHRGVLTFSGVRAWEPTGLSGVVDVSMSRPAFEERRRYWASHLAAAHSDPDLADELAGRFHLGPGQVADAVAVAVTGAGDAPPTREAVFRAARGRAAHHLSALALRVEPAYDWPDLVLPDESARQLRDLCGRVILGRRVWQDWGFDSKFARNRGATALFAGPSGTGKTMAAEVVANEVGLDLFTIDLSTVVSKYIGETEKNLERIFSAATDADAILMFDEADALFGKRTQVRDAHDRYANIETAFLLQRMERYEGVAILATNMRQHLDEAFIRRLQFVIDFPFPDISQRRALWEASFPDRAPRERDLDLDLLARELRLTGANIRNVVLHAAFLAAGEDRPIGRPHVEEAIRHEYRKLGRVFSDVIPEAETHGDAADVEPVR